MSQNHLNLICIELKLGSLKGEAIRVYGSRGGSLVWRINTDKASYAIKQLAPAIDLKNETIIKKYEVSEMIADQLMQHDIPAISALEKNGKHLIIIENIGYLIYPWIDGYSLERNEVTETHALKISEIIAKMHNINLILAEVREPRFDIYSNDQIIEVISRSILFNYPFAKRLKENQNLLLSMNDSYQAGIPVLKENTIITHGDLDPLNVLWNKKGEFFLIDWESARRLNATRDIVRTSLSWSSCFSTETSALQNYSRMLNMYIKSGGILNMNHMDAALRSGFGSQIYWLLYNIDLFCSSGISDVKNTAVNEMNSVLISMKKLKEMIPELLKISIRKNMER